MERLPCRLLTAHDTASFLHWLAVSRDHAVEYEVPAVSSALVRRLTADDYLPVVAEWEGQEVACIIFYGAPQERVTYIMLWEWDISCPQRLIDGANFSIMLRAYDEGRQRPAFWGNTRVKGWQPTENAKRGANPAPWLQEEGLAYVEPLDAAHTDPETQVGPSWFQEVALKLQEL